VCRTLSVYGFYSDTEKTDRLDALFLDKILFTYDPLLQNIKKGRGNFRIGRHNSYKSISEENMSSFCY
jgi:hypothetical protein